MNKAHVISAFHDAVGADLAALVQVTAEARNEATGAESKSEGKYDTRATEASYLAAGQGRRLLALQHLMAWLAHVDATFAPTQVTEGALVHLSTLRSTPRWLLVGPSGGPRVVVDGHDVSLVSLSSPLGQELDGAEAGDVIAVASPRGQEDELDVVSVQ